MRLVTLTRDNRVQVMADLWQWLKTGEGDR
jgi:hypothetical protein